MSWSAGEIQCIFTTFHACFLRWITQFFLHCVHARSCVQHLYSGPNCRLCTRHNETIRFVPIDGKRTTENWLIYGSRFFPSSSSSFSARSHSSSLQCSTVELGAEIRFVETSKQILIHRRSFNRNNFFNPISHQCNCVGAVDKSQFKTHTHILHNNNNLALYCVRWSCWTSFVRAAMP